MNAQRLYNPVVMWLLRSPLHRFGDQHTLLLTVTGRKSGKRYTFPVSYLRDGEAFLVMTHRERTWWRNLQDGGAPVTVYVDGHELPARAEIFTDPDVVAGYLLKFLWQVPTWRMDTHLKLDPSGQPENPEAFTRLAKRDLVVCRILVEPAPSHEPATVQSGAAPVVTE